MSTSTLHRSKAPNGKSHSAVLAELSNGDHLSLPEFERRYWEIKEDKHFELIEGIVIMAPPVGVVHGESHSSLAYYLGRYARATPGVGACLNTSIRLDGRNEFQPDALLRIESERLGRTRVGDKDLIEGGPEFVAEIAASSAGYDLHEKKSVYQRSGAPEYFVWLVMDSRVHWFSLVQGEYIELKPRKDGVIRSRVFPGLWIDAPALLAGDDPKVSRALEKGLKSAEHKAFVRKLAQA